jgi:hypothetical protein
MRTQRTRREPWWSVAGLTRRQEVVLRWSMIVIVALLGAGWTISIVDAYGAPQQVFTPSGPGAELTRVVTPAARSVGSSIFSPRAQAPAFISDAAMERFSPLRGHSGKLRVAFRTPGSPVITPAGDAASVRYSGDGGEVVSRDFTAPDDPGIYKLALEVDRATRPVSDISLITLVPFAEKKEGKIGLYFLGSWPYERGGKPKSAAYANPTGFIEVTQQNKDFFVSEHFRLRDFLTKDQPNKWPKYLLLDPRLVDKLELAIAELEKEGVDVKHMAVMSGFRTPRYNHSGGNTAGRANLSRHMYGDAADVYVDNDRNGNMDDINRDGRVTTADAELLGAMVERVERKYPSLVGGIGVYSACCGHGPFTHVDVRGSRARWRGSGNG